MDGVTAPTLGRSEVLALADSERSVRPESPTSPVSITPYLSPTKPKGKGGRAKTKPHTPEREC